MHDTIEIIEREVKLSLAGPDDYRRFAGALPAPRRWGMQLNVYLDTSDGRLRARRVSLRVRITPDHARLTMKCPPGDQTTRDQETGAFVNVETEVEMDRGKALAWVTGPAAATPWDVPGFGALREWLGGGGLVVSAWSLTRRAVCDTAWGVTVELDETVFPDGVRDFEVEAEHPDAVLARRVLELHAARAGVAVEVQVMSKYARARAHRGGVRWVVPSGRADMAQPPLFVDAAPTAWFAVDQTGYVDPSR